ncbi:hypothetical protein GOP47_0020634 [Adiantum capillus-veneris]|uniref:Uncharacterized protein n=1 Tax=Adiantum capillus-veneris TaxID=13818 RepID=A0A9D4U9H6_ADICA|nr:hypothetical protein GOP47_0020634 [Adiantum capillus-veneris]
MIASQATFSTVAEPHGFGRHWQTPEHGTLLKCWGHWNAGWQPSVKLAFMPRKAVNGKENLPLVQAATNDTPYSSNEGKLSREVTGAKQLAQYDSKQKGNEGEDPYRILETGRKVYLDELDVLTLLDPPSFLIPSDANAYNQAAYLWKKIGDIPEERRHCLLDLLTPKHVANMWDITGQIYELPNRPSLEPANVLLGTQSELFMKPVTWTGKAFNVSWPLSWFSEFQKAFFLATDGSVYGRVITGGSMLRSMTKSLLPLYFEVRETRKVVATEEPCNIAIEYGDGQLHLKEVPDNFPKPARHPWPFNDASFDYLRPAGPGVIKQAPYYLSWVNVVNLYCWSSFPHGSSIIAYTQFTSF